MPDITPIVTLFQSLPDSWWKGVALIAAVYGFGALIAYKTRNSSSGDTFLFWDDFNDCDS
jgi:hypothetical protein